MFNFGGVGFFLFVFLPFLFRQCIGSSCHFITHALRRRREAVCLYCPPISGMPRGSRWCLRGRSALLRSLAAWMVRPC